MDAEETQAATENEALETLYESSYQWVQDFLSALYHRAVGSQFAWCAYWWKHDEAVYRLEALWRAWEYMRVADPAVGNIAWLTQYADPTMNALTQPDGCFKGCTPTAHRSYSHHPDGRLPTAPMDQVLEEQR